MLAEDQKSQLKKILEKELQQTGQTIGELTKLLKPVSPDNAIGRLSRMDALEMQSVNKSKLERQQQYKTQIIQALVRLDKDPDFGVCLECGDPINLERLKLSPQSRYCVTCSEQR